MIRALAAIGILSSFSFVFQSCSSGRNDIDLIEDSTALAEGRILFNQKCGGCHNFVRDGIGPQLSEASRNLSVDWLTNFIKDPNQIIAAGDDRAKELMERYRVVMSSFAYIGDDKIKNIVAYIKSVKEKVIVDNDTTFIQDPIPEKIEKSRMFLQLNEVIQLPSSSKESPRTRISKIDTHPGSDNLYIMDLRGKLYVLRDGKPEVYLDLEAQKINFIDEPGLATGFGSFAFHPDFLKNGLLYTSHTESHGSGKADFLYNDTIPTEVQWVVTEWKTVSPETFTFSGESRELFRINFVTGMHGMQELTFNGTAPPGSKDYGNLYIGIGDGASVEYFFPELVHDVKKPWGTIFRIDPLGKNSKNGNYGIPIDNPYANDPDKVGEIYAYGFRNPHRINWTRDGKMIAINIGQSNIEAMYIIKPGHDYGWPIREGSFMVNPKGNINKVHELPADDSIYHITYPVVQYDHDEGNSISGGFEYSGSAIRPLKGKYLFGDILTGRIFFVETKDLRLGKIAKIRELGIYFNGKEVTMKQLCGDERVDLRFATDHQGELYLFTKPDGMVYKITGVTMR